MCRSSTITMGSATAVSRLRSPEEEEADHHGGNGPPDGVVPEMAGVGVVVTVGAVVLEAGRGVHLMAKSVPGMAQRAAERLAARRTESLALQQRVADQGDVQRGRIDLEQDDSPAVSPDVQ